MDANDTEAQQIAVMRHHTFWSLDDNLILIIEARFRYHALCNTLSIRLGDAIPHDHHATLQVHQAGVDIGIIPYLSQWYQHIRTNSVLDNLEHCQLVMQALRADVRQADVNFQLAKADPSHGQNDQPLSIPPPDAHHILHLTTEQHNQHLLIIQSKRIIPFQIQLVMTHYFAHTFQGLATEIIKLHQVMIHSHSDTALVSSPVTILHRLTVSQNYTNSPTA